MVIWFLILLVHSQNPGNSKLMMAEHLNRQGLYIYALNQLDSIIDKGLADSDVYSFRGNVLSQRGMYSSAITDFETGLDSNRMARVDGERYAYAQYVFGNCSAPDKLRSLRYFGELPRAASIRLMSTEIEMLRYCNRIAEAHSIHVEMMRMFPRAVKTSLAQADLALDDGDLDLAWRSVFSSQIYYKYSGVADLLARIALVEGRYEDAFLLMGYIKSQRVPDRSMILKGLATVLAGDSSALLFRLSQPRWMMNENPHIVFLRLWALDSAGETQQYIDTLQWLRSYCDTDCIQWVQNNLEREIQRSLPFRIL